jgi:hypothetical protein
MKIVFVILMLGALSASGAPMTVGPNTKRIVPTQFIYAFPVLDWKKVEALQAKGKKYFQQITMTCDDSHIELTEIKVGGGLTGVAIQTDSCQLFGAEPGFRDGDAWLQFGASKNNGSCTIQIMKKSNSGKPLVATFDLQDSC